MVVYKRYEEEYGYNQGIPVPDRFYLSLLNCVSIDDYKTTLDYYPQHFAPDGLNSEMNYKSQFAYNCADQSRLFFEGSFLPECRFAAGDDMQKTVQQ